MVHMARRCDDPELLAIRRERSPVAHRARDSDKFAVIGPQAPSESHWSTVVAEPGFNRDRQQSCVKALEFVECKRSSVGRLRGDH
jgi:hypothetical protein